MQRNYQIKVVSMKLILSTLNSDKQKESFHSSSKLLPENRRSPTSSYSDSRKKKENISALSNPSKLLDTRSKFSIILQVDFLILAKISEVLPGDKESIENSMTHQNFQLKKIIESKRFVSLSSNSIFFLLQLHINYKKEAKKRAN